MKTEIKIFPTRSSLLSINQGVWTEYDMKAYRLDKFGNFRFAAIHITFEFEVELIP